MKTGPIWPYPQVPPRKTGGFDLTFGIGMLVGGLFCAVLGAAMTPMAFHMLAASKRGGFGNAMMLGMIPLFAVLLGAMGIVSIRSARAQTKQAEALTHGGVGCWGRIREAKPGTMARKVNALRWIEVHIVVDAFVAGGEKNTTLQPGLCLAEGITVKWFVSELQMSLVQPGELVAVLVNPRDTTQVYLDGFATEDGTFIAAT